jgi:hypothetical protein
MQTGMQAGSERSKHIVAYVTRLTHQAHSLAEFPDPAFSAASRPENTGLGLSVVITPEFGEPL